MMFWFCGYENLRVCLQVKNYIPHNFELFINVKMLEMHWWWKISKIYPGKCHLHTYTHTHSRERILQPYDDNCGRIFYQKSSHPLLILNRHTMPSNILKIYVKCTRQCCGQEDKANH